MQITDSPNRARMDNGEGLSHRLLVCSLIIRKLLTVIAMPRGEAVRLCGDCIEQKLQLIHRVRSVALITKANVMTFDRRWMEKQGR